MIWTIWEATEHATEETHGETIYGDPDDLEDILADYVEQWDQGSACELTNQLLEGGIVVNVRAEGSDVVKQYTLRAEASLNYYARPVE